MKAPEPGEAAIRSPWLPPGVSALVSLARTDSADAWSAVRHDPGAVLLLLRHLPPSSPPDLPDAPFRSPGPLECALRCWQETSGRVIDWLNADLAPVYQAALAYAMLAEQLARLTGGCDPASAWAAGMLAPLGWLAVAAIDPAAVGEVLRQPVYSDRFADAQRSHWGLDSSAIARRLVRRWNLPVWLRATSGHLNLSADLAVSLGADERLFQIVQLTVLLSRETGHDLGLRVGGDITELTQALGLTADDIHRATTACRESAAPVPPNRTALSPDLLPDLLAVAIQKRQLQQGPLGERIEDEIDQLQEALAEQQAGEAERLHRAKLRSLAEFAAGASHEINNPLAVISGHAQYLLNRETDPSRLTPLRGIIRQTERIHQILTDLMQFARPPRPRRQDIDLRHVIREVVARHTPLADEAPRLEWHDPGEPLPVRADPAMVTTALSCLIRNAQEAAPRDGWTRIMIEQSDHSWDIVVEDSGPGPTTTRREHLFDPFFSGRSAGRGRGLGLSTAWRLAGENGGDVRFDPRPGRPSRFVLTLPVCASGSSPNEPPVDSLRKTA